MVDKIEKVDSVKCSTERRMTCVVTSFKSRTKEKRQTIRDVGVFRSFGSYSTHLQPSKHMFELRNGIEFTTTGKIKRSMTCSIFPDEGEGKTIACESTG